MELSTLQIIIAIVAGFTATVLGIVNFARSRSRLHIKSITAVSVESKNVQIEVTNIGAKDVSLLECGFVVLPRSEPFLGLVRWRRRRLARRYSELGTIVDDDGEEHEEIIFLKPTDRRVFKIRMSFVAGWLTEGEVAWPYVQDTHGRMQFADRPAQVERPSGTV